MRTCTYCGEDATEGTRDEPLCERCEALLEARMAEHTAAAINRLHDAMATDRIKEGQ